MYRWNHKYKNKEVDPDEIFLDSKNIPRFDVHQLEGRLERPISRTTYFVLSSLFILGGLFLLGEISNLELVRGAELRRRAERNSFNRIPLFATRGVIYDRNGILLAWNGPDRTYRYIPGLGAVVGYVGLPNAEEIESGAAIRGELIGRAGVERVQNVILRGVAGLKLEEQDANGILQSEYIQTTPKDGVGVTLSIDSGLSSEIYRAMENLAKERGFESGAAVLMDVRNGELLTAVSYPSFDPNVFVTKNKSEELARYMDDKRKPFLDRVVSGQYTPGSVIKPFIAVAALNEGIVDENKQIFSSGSLRVPNPYSPGKDSVFLDWKAHGLVDMRHAIAVSSDVYFYEIGGGFGDQKGLGITAIAQYLRMFGFGEPTGVEMSGERLGVIPTPRWKAENFNDEPWRLGDTYHTVIGQYGLQVTPLQMARAIAMLSTDGLLITPTLLKRRENAPPRSSVRLSIPANIFRVVKEGMRLAVTEGTAMGLSNPTVKIAAKTGTAELGVGKSQVNSWVVGFLPYESPNIVFVLVMERGPRANLVGATSAMREVLNWMIKNRPDYLSLPIL